MGMRLGFVHATENDENIVEEGLNHGLRQTVGGGLSTPAG
jgi:hypothetical protein